MRNLFFISIFNCFILTGYSQLNSGITKINTRSIEKPLLINPKSLQSSMADTIHVLHYDIHIDTLNFTSGLLRGHTGIELISLIDNLNEVKLSLLDLVVDSIIAEDGSILTYFHNNPELSILPTSNLQTGDTLKFTVYYQGNPPEDPSGWGGFTFSGSYAFNMGVGFEVNPHVFGRAWFPCLDEFTDKSMYDFHIKTNGTNSAHCNGELTGIDSFPDQSKIYHWHLSHPIPSYLAGMAVGPYTTHYDTSYGIPVEIAAVGTDGASILTTMAKLDTAVRVFQEYYGPYPWNKIGYTTVPFNAGAMEHATNIHIGRLFMNGSLDYETLWAHELSHMWWGDLVTCKTQEDMWLNEGFASFNERLFTEAAYGKTAYKDDIRRNHRSVIQYSHISDGNYFALNAVPFSATYGSTVYDKGADIAHTLRGFLGDSLFKIGTQHYMQSLSFANASSEDFRDKLTQATNVDLNDFFEGWVFTPGFPHFSLDSFRVSAIPLNAWKVDIYTSQQGLANNHLIRMPVKIAFYNGSHVTEEHSFLIDSLQNHFSIEVALPPTMLAIDRNEEMSDAVVDYEKKIKSTGSHVFLETNCTLVVDQASADSVLVRVEHHFVAPDTLDLPNGITKLSDYHYWTVNGSWDTTFLAKAKFFYDGTTSTTVGYQDNTFITGSENYLRLMYRPNRGSNWTVVDGFTLNKGASTSDKRGNIQVEHLKKGEYCLGWSETMLAIKDKENKKPGFVISPNPTRDILTIDVEKLSHPEEWNVMLVDTQGRMVMQTTLYPHQSFIKLDISQLKAGIYLVKLGNLANQSPLSQRFVKE